MNGDGYADVIVGARNYSNGEASEGAAFLFLGNSSGVSASPSWSAEGDQSNAWFGYNSSMAGDINADGYADVLVSAPQFDGGETDEGRVYLYIGSPSGLGSSPSWQPQSASLVQPRSGALTSPSGITLAEPHAEPATM